MPEIYLRQPGFTYSACGPLTQKVKETADSRCNHQNEPDKACFQHMAYGDFKDLPRRIASNKALGVKHL